MSSTIALEKAIRWIEEGGRLNDAGAMALLDGAPLAELARLASMVRRRLHPSDVATWCADRNINYTNICESRCAFCAYWRPPGHPEAFVLDRSEIFRKVDELVALGGTQVLLQGGHNPDIPFEWYLELLRGIKERFRVHIHAFSPPEICFFSRRFRMPVRRILEEMKAAGLDSLPGGGAEILVDRVRSLISPAKIGADDWLAVMRCAHGVGLKGSATMVFGHIETIEERIEHLRRIRELQDETGGLDRGVFTAFIPWPMQPRNTALEGKIRRTTASEYLRVLAVSRLYLDSIRNIQGGWVTEGAGVGQMAMCFGANDWGGWMMEEKVVASAGTRHSLDVETMRRLSAELGLTLRRRDYFYRLID